MITLDWGRMAFTDTGGDGRPCVLLHGSGCDAADWASVLAARPPGLRCVCPDLRGHGNSAVPVSGFGLDDLAGDVVDLLDRLGLERAILAGHSLGGFVAMLAAARSERVAGLVLLEGWTNSRAPAAFKGARLLAGLEPEAVMEVRRKLYDTRARIGASAWGVLSASCVAFNGGPYLESARIPIVEAYGEAGRVPDTEKGLDIPPNPRIAIRWIPGAGHYLPHARPRQVAQLLADKILQQAGS